MIAASDSSLEQYSADAVLVGLILLNALLGWRTGLVRRVLAFAGLYAGVLAAFYVGNGLAAIFRKGDIYANAWSFVAVAGGVVLVFEVLGRLWSDHLERLSVVVFDRVAGTLVGATVGFFQASVLFMVALAVGAAPSGAGNTVPVGHDHLAKAIQSSSLAGQATRVQPGIRRIYAPVMPTDLSAHLEEGTQTTH